MVKILVSKSSVLSMHKLAKDVLGTHELAKDMLSTHELAKDVLREKLSTTIRLNLLITFLLITPYQNLLRCKKMQKPQ